MPGLKSAMDTGQDQTVTSVQQDTMETAVIATVFLLITGIRAVILVTERVWIEEQDSLCYVLYD